MAVLHTTHCPQCKVLQSKLEAKGIDFEIDEDIDHILALGYKSAPILEVNGSAMLFSDAIKWVDAQ